MKKTLILALTLMLISTATRADEISVYGDPAGNACVLTYTGPGGFTAYVIHKTVVGATGSRFKVVNNTELSWSAGYVGGYLDIGDAFSDLSVTYSGNCLPGPNIVVLQLTAFVLGPLSDACQTIQVAAVPTKTFPLSIDCNFMELPVNTFPFFLRADPQDDNCGCVIVATEQSTWGKVKSLYR